jgi:hypothetical protein
VFLNVPAQIAGLSRSTTGTVQAKVGPVLFVEMFCLVSEVQRTPAVTRSCSVSE